MGPNGSAKARWRRCCGRRLYVVTGGEVIYDGKDLLAMLPKTARARHLPCVQYPVEIPGVSNMYFLKAALNAIPQAPRPRGAGCHWTSSPWSREDEAAGDDQVLLNRAVNTGSPAARRGATRFSKMACRPNWRIRRTDSASISLPARRGGRRQRGCARRPAMIVVTHYQRLLNYIVPIMCMCWLEGRIVESGGKELALARTEERLRRPGHET